MYLFNSWNLKKKIWKVIEVLTWNTSWVSCSISDFWQEIFVPSISWWLLDRQKMQELCRWHFKMLHCFNQNFIKSFNKIHCWIALYEEFNKMHKCSIWIEVFELWHLFEGGKIFASCFEMHISKPLSLIGIGVFDLWLSDYNCTNPFGKI